jgi:RimJ/RimL family protein N-acetyltransferase
MAVALLCDAGAVRVFSDGRAHRAFAWDDTALRRNSDMHDSTIALTRVLRTPSASTARSASPAVEPWRHGLPELRGARVTLRELRADDGAALLPLITAPEVTRFMSPTPELPDWFTSFVASTSRERKAGRYAGFAIVPHDHDHAVGLVQIRQLAPGFSTAEWGIALGSAWWGKGFFEDTGRLILRFAFETLGVHRLEARVAQQNARGNAAVSKLGAVAEGQLRRALRTADGQYHDQILWSWLVEEWRREVAKRRAEELVWVH